MRNASRRALTHLGLGMLLWQVQLFIIFVCIFFELLICFNFEFLDYWLEFMVISGTTQVLEVKREYTIPFTKEKVDEKPKNFRNPLSCIIIAQDGRKHSCTLSEFRDMSYDELVNLKTGYTDFMKNRRGQKVYS